MDAQFRKFKNRIILHSAIESAVAGLAAALIVVAAILLAATLNHLGLNVGIYIGAGLGAFVLAGGITFALLWPTDKKIARRVDKELAMNEKVQTMVEFSSSQDSMAAIQREDTSARLGAAGAKSIRFKRVWQCAVASVVSVGLFAASLVAFIIVGGPVPVNADLSLWDLTRLRNLISQVEDSDLDEEPKAVTLKELHALEDFIYDETTGTYKTVSEEDLIAEVVDSMIAIDAAVDNVITAEPIGLSLNEKCTNEEFSYLGLHIAALNTVTTRSSFTQFKVNLYDDAFAESTLADAVALISEYSAQIYAGLDGLSSYSGEILYTSLAALADGFDSAVALAGDGQDEDLLPDVLSAARSAIDSCSGTVIIELADQSLDRQIGEQIIYDLQDIFDIPDGAMPDLGEPVTDMLPDDDNDGENDPDDGGDGGAGRGDTLWGDDSIIYDQTSDDYTAYGDVFNRFSAIITELAQSGDLSEELMDLINIYYDMLASGIEENTPTEDTPETGEEEAA